MSANLRAGVAAFDAVAMSIYAYLQTGGFGNPGIDLMLWGSAAAAGNMLCGAPAVAIAAAATKPARVRARGLRLRLNLPLPAERPERVHTRAPVAVPRFDGKLEPLHRGRAAVHDDAMKVLDVVFVWPVVVGVVAARHF